LAGGGIANPRDAVQEGQAVRVRVLEIDAAQQRMKLSLRAPAPQGGSAAPALPNPPGESKIPPAPPLDPGYWDSLVKSG